MQAHALEGFDELAAVPTKTRVKEDVWASPT